MKNDNNKQKDEQIVTLTAIMVDILSLSADEFVIFKENNKDLINRLLAKLGVQHDTQK